MVVMKEETDEKPIAARRGKFLLEAGVAVWEHWEEYLAEMKEMGLTADRTEFMGLISDLYFALIDQARKDHAGPLQEALADELDRR